MTSTTNGIVGEVYSGPRRSQGRSEDADIYIYIDFLANYRVYNVLLQVKGEIITSN